MQSMCHETDITLLLKRVCVCLSVCVCVCVTVCVCVYYQSCAEVSELMS